MLYRDNIDINYIQSTTSYYCPLNSITLKRGCQQGKRKYASFYNCGDKTCGDALVATAEPGESDPVALCGLLPARVRVCRCVCVCVCVCRWLCV